MGGPIRSLAQLVELRIPNPKVGGSSPSRPARFYLKKDQEFHPVFNLAKTPVSFLTFTFAGAFFAIVSWRMARDSFGNLASSPPNGFIGSALFS